MNPLVSIIMPTYNARHTLPWAIASLYAQTYENWEVIIVDDGSTDQTRQYLSSFTDSRIRCLINEQNLGRGKSRQRALEAARGTYIALLDADDWMFPDRIRYQVETLNSEPGIVLVSSGAAIVNLNEELIGVRGISSAPVIQVSKRIGPTPFVFATSMFRLNSATGHQFYERYPLAEDSHFMMRLLLGKRFMMLPALGYAYREHSSASVPKMVLSHQCMAMIYLSHRREFPAVSFMLAAKSLLKAGLWRAVSWFGMETRIITNRSMPPTREQEEEYRIAVQTVSSYLRP